MLPARIAATLYPRGANWSKTGAAFDANFVRGIAAFDGRPIPLLTALHNAQNSPGFAQQRNGFWQGFPTNTLARTDLGLLATTQAVNSLRNNSMVGASAGTPGTLPTNWIAQALGTVSLGVASVGTDDITGLPSIDFHFSGTTNNTQGQITFDGNTAVAAAPGDVWAGSFWAYLKAGSLANVGKCQLSVIYRDSGSTIVGQEYYPLTLTSSPQMFFDITAGAPAGTAYVQLRYYQLWTNGQAIDATVRIIAPMLVHGAAVPAPIITTNAAATKYADVITAQKTGITDWVLTYSDNSQVVVTEQEPAVKYVLPTSTKYLTRATGYSVDAKIASLMARVTSDQIVGHNYLTFSWITDTHSLVLSDSWHKHVRWAAKIAPYGLCDFMVMGGDSINPSQVNPGNVKATMLANMDADVATMVATGVPWVFLHGNHDDNGINTSSANYIPLSEFYTHCQQPLEAGNGITLASAGATYGYIDVPAKKIRILVLDTSESDVTHQSYYALTGTQLAWITGTALNLSSKGADALNWTVIPWYHACRRDIGGWNSEGPGIGSNVTNFDILINILKACAAGTSYTASGGSGNYAYNINVNYATLNGGPIGIPASFHGDAHYTNHYKPIGEPTYVVLSSTHYNAPADQITGLLGSPTTYPRGDGPYEAIFYVITIDLTAGTVALRAFGAGADLLFSV